MMGRRKDEQGQFFYSFDLDKLVPRDHLVRQIDGVLDLGWVHKELAPYYSHTGRPSIDPVLMIRMLIVGYVFAIRSERRLCSEVQVNLDYKVVLQARHRGKDSRSFGVLSRAARAVPRERCFAPCIRRPGSDVHRGRARWRRSVLGRCEPD